MQFDRPSFLDSPYFVPEPNNWHLKPGAPQDVQAEFDNFMASLNAGAPRKGGD